MALFLGVHDMGQSVPEEQMTGGWQAYKAACEKSGCKALHAHISPETGKAFCITEASSADEVRAAHDVANVPLKEIIPIKTIE